MMSNMAQQYIGEYCLLSPLAMDAMADLMAATPVIPTEENTTVEPLSFNGMERFSDESFISYRSGNVGIVVISGMIVPNGRPYHTYWGVTPLNVVKKEVMALQEDSSITKIVFAYNSPGGYASALTDFSKFIRGLGETYGYVSGQSASASYFLSSQHSKLYGSEMSQVGSIGTIIKFVRSEGALKAQGYEPVTVVSVQSPYKDAMAAKNENKLQEMTNSLTDIFVSYVAEGRNVSEDVVKSTFGQGGMLLAKDAITAGMMDEVMTFDEMVETLSEKKEGDALSDFNIDVSMCNSTPSKGSSMKGGSPVANEEKALTPEELRQQHPELFAQIVADATAEGAATAVQAEQARVKGINGLMAELGEASPAAKAAAEKVIATALEDKNANADSTRGKMFQAAFTAKETKNGDALEHGKKVADAAEQMGNTTPSKAPAFDEKTEGSGYSAAEANLQKLGFLKGDK
jgi:ClpP class serine protease